MPLLQSVSLDFVVQRVFCRHDDDTHGIAPAPEFAQEVQPVATGQHQVEHHAVIVIQTGLHPGFLVGECLLTHVIFRTEVGHDVVRQFSFVFYNQQFHLNRE